MKNGILYQHCRTSMLQLKTNDRFFALARMSLKCRSLSVMMGMTKMRVAL